MISSIVKTIKKEHTIIGIMSGTSLDGLDIAYCGFSYNETLKHWDFQIKETKEIPYTTAWQERLQNSIHLSALDLLVLHQEYGKWLGEQCLLFKQNHQIPNTVPIASHGHTVFHQPTDKGITFQIGHGQYLANAALSTVVCDFRTQDVSLGGQGAPLVPIGDQLLFSSYTICVNLGGIANLSYYDVSCDKRIAYDVTIVNMAFNYMAKELGVAYDKGGHLAKSGTINTVLLEQLNRLDFYQKSFPKSLGVEWFNQSVLPLIIACDDTPHNILRTLLEHSVIQLATCLQSAKIVSKKTPSDSKISVLCTGGGAKNTFYIERLQQVLSSYSLEVIVPDSQIIDYKEALIFGFFGILRLQNQPNCFASVTNCIQDHSSGVVYTPAIQ